MLPIAPLIRALVPVARALQPVAEKAIAKGVNKLKENNNNKKQIRVNPTSIKINQNDSSEKKQVEKVEQKEENKPLMSKASTSHFGLEKESNNKKVENVKLIDLKSRI